MQEKEKPVWLKRNAEEIDAIVVKLAKQGTSLEKIGLELRDKYGIPKTKIISEKISLILKKNKIEQQQQDLKNLIDKAKLIKKHLAKNKKDVVAKRGLQLTLAKINKLAKYYKKKKILPEDWKHS